MRPQLLIVPALSLTLLAPLGCKSTGSSDGRSTNTIAQTRMSIETYRSRLVQIKPRIAEVVDSANTMFANRATDPIGTSNTFRRAVTRLNGDVAAIREQADILQHLGYNEYFLDADRTVASTGQAGVLAARERFGKVGDYMVALRNEAHTMSDRLAAIERTIGATPTAESIANAQNDIGSLNNDRIRVESLVDLVVQSIDEARAMTR